MKIMKMSAIAALVAITMAPSAHALEKYNLLATGYYDGPSVFGAVGLGEIFEKVPLGLELELGYSWTRKGDATLACQVFINQNQNNNRETISSGGVLDLGFNATYPLIQKYGPIKFVGFGGLRYARWAVRHQYVNGNEDFDVVSHVWGMGAGLRGETELSKNFGAFLQLGLDFYFRSSIYGHDATYYPDNANINARDNGAGYTYTYEDALRATTIPRLRPRVMLGIKF